MKKPGRTGGGVAASWTVEEALAGLERLLLAATEAPQEIRFGNRRYTVVALHEKGAPDGRALLKGGGPLDDEDVLD